LAHDDSLSLAFSVIGACLQQIRQPSRWEDSFENYQHAAENGSKNATNFLWRAEAYMELGYLELAMSDLDKCLSIDPQYGNCHRHKAMLYLLRGDRNKGIALFLQTLKSNVSGSQPLFVSGSQPLFVSAFALSGNEVAALLLADLETGRTGAPIVDWVNLIETPDIDRHMPMKAFNRWIEHENINTNMLEPMAIAFGAYDRITHNSTHIYRIWLPEFAEFRQSPHFKRVISEFDMLPFWQSHGFPPQCRPIGDQDFECD
jgi:tetratricopeptide (TPR) repeat protein